MPGFNVHSTRNVQDHYPSTNEYYYSYTWEITDLFQGTDIVTISRTKEPSLLNWRVGLKDCTLPTLTINKETVEGAQLEYKFAKSVSWEDVTVTWYDTERLFEQVIYWRGLVWDSTSDQGLKAASEYKKLSVIKAYPGSWAVDSKALPQVYTLHNSWPSSIKYGDLTYTSSEVKLVSVTITYDWAVESEERPSN